ncbi:type II toxin-antitoxin system HipA family toxin [Agaribacterium haliotis]|uniref:type II toxin-antitoxin system HipA family toxin n=1 Tax=Agaribacterium haliotis TaxID=2013869 RepID=UPI000BB55AA1|nr:type II toxin-antitoxin system HipA family toxin [Agaribacterium haliotis]
MAFKPVQKLEVFRTLQTGEKLPVGVLAQNQQAVFFQYEQSYLKRFSNLSPFALNFDASLQQAPLTPHFGLHGVFADALPDGWGLLLQDRVFRKQGLLPGNLTAMDRLAFVGNSALGALSFVPVSSYQSDKTNDASLAVLGLNAQKIFDGQTDEVLAALIAAGSSGGARPKAQVFFNKDAAEQCSTQVSADSNAWIVKFTSSNLALGHEEGLCEAAYLTLAQRAGLNPPEWTLLAAPKQSGASRWLAVKRFDCVAKAHTAAEALGRRHLISACGLLDADFRTPSLDYEDLIKATKMLCRSPAAGQLQFKRAIFNLLFCNHDDHSKNFAFLQDDSGQWQPAPFYDVTFSPHPFGEHAMAYAGFAKEPPIKALQKLADVAGFTRWSQAEALIREQIELVSEFSEVARGLGVKNETVGLISKQIQAASSRVLKLL